MIELMCYGRINKKTGESELHITHKYRLQIVKEECDSKDNYKMEKRKNDS